MSSDRRRWDERYAARVPPEEPAPFLTERAALLPARGRALDVAGGGGRNAVWLARRGLSVTLVDVSAEACHIATARAGAASLDMTVSCRDLTAGPPPAGPWDVVLVHHYLDRPLIPALAGSLAPGGLLLWCQPTLVNLQRHEHPSARWLLRPGELAELVGEMAGVEVLELTEGWTPEGRHEARLVLRRPVASA